MATITASCAGWSLAERVSSGQHASSSGSTLLQASPAMVNRGSCRLHVGQVARHAGTSILFANRAEHFLGFPGILERNGQKNQRTRLQRRRVNATRAGYFGEFVDNNEKQQKIQAKRRFQVHSSDHIDGETPLQEVVSGVKGKFNQTVTVPINRTMDGLGNWWNSTLLGRLGNVYNKRRALSVQQYGRWSVFVLFVVFQGSVIGTELLLKHFKVGGLLRPVAVLAVSYLSGPPFIETFLPGLSEERDLKPPDPNKDVVYDDEPKQKWRPPEEIEAEDFFRPLDEP